MDRTKRRWNGWGFTAHKDEITGREEVWTWLAGKLGMPALLATPTRPLEEVTLPQSALSAEDRAALAAIVGADRVLVDTFERAYHARGRSYLDLLRLRAGDLSEAPDAVVTPRATEEVLAVLALAAEREIAVVPFGGGTGVVGGVTAARGRFSAVITLDISEMDCVIAIDPVSQTATVQAGICGPALEKALEAKGFTLGHFPKSFEFSTLGGWIAHRGAAAGRGAEDWLIGAQLATPRGLVSTGDFPASAAGPQWKDLLLGSEGIFGVITQATVRLRPLPEAVEYCSYLFRDFASGLDAIREATQAEIPATMLLLSDAEGTRFCSAYDTLGKPRSLALRIAERYRQWRGFGDGPCALIAGFEDSSKTVAFARRGFAAIAKRHGALSLGRSDCWKKARFALPYLRDPLLDRGVGIDTLETAASWSKLEALYAAVRGAIDGAISQNVPRQGAKGVVLGHVCPCSPDGADLEFTYVFPRLLDGELAQAQAIKKAAMDAVVAHGGTISHHRGVGIEHLPWIAAEKGELGLAALSAVKAALDPKGVMNPGKLLPDKPFALG
jgi:alkyldihydroxyacetonephosphate synthase